MILHRRTIGQNSSEIGHILLPQTKLVMWLKLERKILRNFAPASLITGEEPISVFSYNADSTVGFF